MSHIRVLFGVLICTAFAMLVASYQSLWAAPIAVAFLLLASGAMRLVRGRGSNVWDAFRLWRRRRQLRRAAR